MTAGFTCRRSVKRWRRSKRKSSAPERPDLNCRPFILSTSAVASEQFLKQIDISGLDQVHIETSVEARVADVRIGIACERDQIELRGGEPLTKATSEFNAVHPRQ